ncbi:protein kinase [Streptomyces sp. NPDC018031]|uniref:protein kinase domain-containing protein n=1 Tax=Streptomyces sp. NPDC018031 TaxID=3365033 RepID=UPI0037B2B8EC
MDDYAGRVLADRYRMPLPPSGDAYEPVDAPAFDTYSGQRVLIRQIPLPEVVEAEVVGDARYPSPHGRPARGAEDPAVRRAIDAATAAASLPDHPRLDQVFHVFAEDGSLWIVSEFVAGRPLAALLAERPLSAHRAAEVAADVLTALRAVHAHGWVHRNITTRTVLICEDGRAMLTGLAAGAAQEALCGYDPVPTEPPAPLSPPDPAPAAEPDRPGAEPRVPRARRSPDPADAHPGGGDGSAADGTGADPDTDGTGPGRGPRGAAVAAYHAGARAAGRGEAGHGPDRPAGGSPGAPAAGRRGTEGRSRGGPATVLGAERARQARIAVVGGVTERWAPEQAGPVHANWRLAPPITEATDLWAVGALLFRAVQGHAPYPEDDPAELVQLVCAEAPAYAEECGPLRPVVESLLRQDPAERPESEELRGWLRSLIRSAPEPEVGSRTVVVPSPGSAGPSDPRRLPVVRRRGWLVRRRRGRLGVPAGPPRHRERAEARPPRPRREPKPRPGPREPKLRPGPREPELRRGRGPRSLGRTLLVAILLLLGAAVLYAVLFMPKADEGGDDARGGPDRGGSAAPGGGATGGEPDPGDGSAGGEGDGGNGDRSPQSTQPAGLAKGFAVREDPGGFRVAVHESWSRRGPNSRGQIRYLGGKFELVVVPGRDKAADLGTDPMAYQQAKEPELAAFRASSWSSTSGLRRIDVGGTAMAEGEFRWRDSSGREVCARNLAMLLDGRYHVVQVIGPADERDAVTRYFEQATATYAAPD